MTRRRILIIVCSGTLIAVVTYALYILSIAGEFRSIEPHFDGECRTVRGVIGPEDMAMLPDGSGVFISSNDHQSFAKGGSSHGGIYYLDLVSPDAKPVKVSPEIENFRPHGVGLWGTERLFVVNHPGGDLHGDFDTEGPDHTIEVFDIEGTTLTHHRTVSGEELVTPNDVVPVGPESFYATNDHGTGAKFMRKVEDYLRLSRAHVVFFDGERFRVLPDQVRYANGIAVSQGGDEIYVAATTDRRVFVYQRDYKTNDLKLKQSVFVDSGPDNLFVDAYGDIWIGAHPKLLTMAGYMKGKNETSPTQVLRLVNADGFRVEEVLLSDGTDLSASTVAIHERGRILVGGIFSDGILDCRVKK